MTHRNFRGPANADERGMVFPDMGEVKKITQTIRKMRRYNPVPNQAQMGAGFRNLVIGNLIEDPFFKDSRHSYFSQAADVAAFLLYQRFAPSTYAKKKGLSGYFQRLRPVLCTVASTTNPDGIVLL